MKLRLRTPQADRYNDVAAAKLVQVGDHRLLNGDSWDTIRGFAQRPARNTSC